MDFLEQLNCTKANDLDLVDYLSHLGIQPIKIRKQDYWYLSPIREEKTASFKVNRKLNRWYDHGIGTGGSLVDFGIRFYRCSVAEFLRVLNGNESSIQKPNFSGSFQAEDEEQAVIQIIAQKELCSPALCKYLKKRGIDLQIAKAYCKQVDYSINDQKLFGIGFRNDSSGFEIRNTFSKYGSSPKDVSTFSMGSNKVLVFEGFMDFLSYLSINRNSAEMAANDVLVLNGIGFFAKARPFMEQHDFVDLFLDRDKAGIKLTKHALQLSSKYHDASILYEGYKDLNDWVVNSGQSQRKSLKQGLR